MCKMNKHRNYFQLRDQENSTERTNDKTDFFTLTDSEFKKEIIKILKELRKILNRNADYCKKKKKALEAIKMSQEKLENSFAEMKAELQAMNSRLINVEEWICDLEGRIIEITQLEQQTESQMKKKKKMKAMKETYGIPWSMPTYA